MNELIIELAEEAGLLNCIDSQNYVVHIEAGLAEIKKFAELVRADEREACAKVCEALAEEVRDWADTSSYENAALFIRARGEVK